MAILFKTYNGKHQLHVYGETWNVESSQDLKDILNLFDPKNAKKAAIVPGDKIIELTLNEMIIDCKDQKDLNEKFKAISGFKIKYQNIRKN